MNKKIKKALILGGSSDLGVELTKLFIKNNWQVTIHYSGNNLNFRKRLKKENIKLIKFNFLKINSSIDKNLKIFAKNDFDSVINLVGYKYYHVSLDLCCFPQKFHIFENFQKSAFQKS